MLRGKRLTGLCDRLRAGCDASIAALNAIIDASRRSPSKLAPASLIGERGLLAVEPRGGRIGMHELMHKLELGPSLT